MSMLIIDNNNSMAKVNIEAECKNCSHDMSLHSPTCSRRVITYVVVKDHNIMEPLYLIPMWAGQNSIAISVETLLAFSIL
jgi:hypothetical protein